MNVLRFSVISLLSLVLVLSTSLPLAAQSQVPAPFFTRNLAPFVQVFGLPAVEGGVISAAGETKVRLVADMASNFTEQQTTDEAVLLDGETYRTTLAFRYGFLRRWEVGFDLPIVSHSGGFLDGFIEDWHDFFGMPQGGREDAPHDRLVYSFDQQTGDSQFFLSDSGTGLGDFSVHLAYQLLGSPERVGRYMALRTGLKFPTGDADRLRGSDAFDLHLRLAYTDSQSLSAYRATLFSSIGILWLGQGDVLPEIQRSWVGFGSAGLNWQLLRWLSFKLQLDAQTPFYRESDLEQIDSVSAQLVVGGTMHFSEKWAMDLGVSEDVVVSTAPDVVFHLALVSRF